MSQSEPQQTELDSSAEGLYPIRTVSALTGVNPVTLRAWERRYGLIRPQRTPKGHRLYAEADIQRINRILELLDQGIPIGQTRRLLDNEPTPEPELPVSAEQPWERYRERMLRAITRFDAASLEAIYNETLSLYPVALVTRDLVRPLLDECHKRWIETDGLGTAEGHFFNAFLRNKLGARFHHEAGRARGPRLVVAGLPGESGEAGILLFALEAVAHDYRVVLLGADMPLDPLSLVARRTDARAIMLFGNGARSTAIEDELPRLVEASQAPVILSGGVVRRRASEIEAAGAHALHPGSGEGVDRLPRILRR